MSSNHILKRIPLEYYEDSENNYSDIMESYILECKDLLNALGCSSDMCVKNCLYENEPVTGESGMDYFIMLIAGMLFCMENGGIADDDPVDLAYNTWLAIQDFNTGEFDDLFRPDDLADLKSDIKKITEYFDQHPKLKG